MASRDRRTAVRADRAACRPVPHRRRPRRRAGPVLASTPIIGSGDYGQWLMALARTTWASRARTIGRFRRLPPFVPWPWPGGQLAVVGEPIMALQVTNVLLMVGLGAQPVRCRDRCSPAAPRPVCSASPSGLLVTDHYLELFAFGGLLQATAVMFTSLAVAAFVRARGDHGRGSRWWIAGSVCARPGCPVARRQLARSRSRPGWPWPWTQLAARRHRAGRGFARPGPARAWSWRPSRSSGSWSCSPPAPTT